MKTHGVSELLAELAEWKISCWALYLGKSAPRSLLVVWAVGHWAFQALPSLIVGRRAFWLLLWVSYKEKVDN